MVRRQSRYRWSLRIALSITVALFVGVAAAQGSYTGTNSGQDLVDQDFLFIGAHPDDEGGITGMMARYVLDQGFKGTVTTYTLGEGGGNATGPELGTSLGLIRFEELRRSLHTVGVDRFFFLGLNDFYYTLFAEQTHDNWSAQNPDYICDAVRVVRLTRPEVIVSMWPGPGTHGHHQMAARAAILAFNNAGHPEYCPDHIEAEFLEPWQPLKLYVSARGDRASLEVPVDDFSRSAYMSYADLKALALMNYRSQGWDRFNTVPASERRSSPERRQLVRSLVPINYPEEHLLEGTHVPAGESPVGIRLELDPQSYAVSVGGTLQTLVTFVNDTDGALTNLELSAAGPEGWPVIPQASASVASLAPGESHETTFTLEVPDSEEAIGQANLWVSFEADGEDGAVSGTNHAWLEVVPPVGVSFQPMFDIANYREFARETDTEWLIPSLATRVPLTTGEANPVVIEVTNESEGAASGRLEFDLPHGISVEGNRDFDVAANDVEEVTVDLVVDGGALPEGEHSAALEGTVSTNVRGYTSTNATDLYALPTLEVPRVAAAPAIDGDLADMEGLATAAISHLDTWSGSVDTAEDLSGEFHLGYDDDRLYVGVRVRDEQVVCHMPPDEIRNHWHADSVELTIDPYGDSENTSSTFKVGIFPCTTEGFGARAARDADANQGVIEQTAPGMQVASQQLEDGYTIQASIPWTDMPTAPDPGDAIGFNVLIYDADDAEAGAASPGANLGESRSGWASVLGAQQAIPYVWPRVTLQE